MREQRNYIVCSVATANGFAMPYRARPVTAIDESVAAEDDVMPAMRRPLMAGVLATLAKGKRTSKS
ncbi:MAG: hypothetical protein WA717_01655 [Methyloceanibacter sp.]